MSRIVRIKNVTNSAFFISGYELQPDIYFTISNNNLNYFSEDDNLFLKIGLGEVLVNDGTSADFTDTTSGWNWLVGNTEPPKTEEGFWTVSNRSESLLTGNQTVNWVANRFLDSQSEFSETFIIPNNRSFVLTMFSTDSPNVSVFSTLEFFLHIQDEEYFRISTNIDPSMVWVMKSTVSADSSDGQVNVTYNQYVDPVALPVSSVYAVTPVSGENSVLGYIKVNEINISSNTIFFSAFSNFDFFPNARIGLVDRYITALGTESNTAIVSYASPLTFVGNGKNFLKLTVRNTHQTDAGFAGAAINGYLTNL